MVYPFVLHNHSEHLKKKKNKHIFISNRWRLWTTQGQWWILHAQLWETQDESVWHDFVLQTLCLKHLSTFCFYMFVIKKTKPKQHMHQHAGGRIGWDDRVGLRTFCFPTQQTSGGFPPSPPLRVLGGSLKIRNIIPVKNKMVVTSK